jgi:8-amino-7-oxononanoate synthase
MINSLERFCTSKLEQLEQLQRRRHSVPTRRLPGLRAERVRNGARVTLVDFSANDSLGLAHHDDVVAAAAAALADGAGSGGSRLVTGAHEHLSWLEAAIAAHKGTEAALVVGSGWLANVGVIPALCGAGDVVVVDALAHASLMTGVQLARANGAAVDVVAHNDAAAFAQAVAAARAQKPEAHILVVTESVFSMDGDLAPLRALRAVCDAHDAWLLVDDAHGFLVDLDTPPPAVFAHVVTGTLSKACGSYGGTIAGPSSLCALLLSRARPVLFGTSLPPSVVAAAHAALQVAEREPERRRRPLLLAQRLCAAVGLPAPTSHIVPVVVGAETSALALMEHLADDGQLVVAIRPPTVPLGTSRLRISLSAGHSDDDVDSLARSLCQHWRR